MYAASDGGEMQKVFDAPVKKKQGAEFDERFVFG